MSIMRSSIITTVRIVGLFVDNAVRPFVRKVVVLTAER